MKQKVKNNMFTKHQISTAVTKYFLPSLLAIILFGCSLWRDFTTYFNTYYNAKTLFEEVEEEILLIPRALFTFKEEPVSSKLNGSLEKVIEKCSKIMQYENESSYFPNALFMTGKAFYYQGNYAKALRKFLELSGIEDEEFLLASKLWIGKSQLQLRDYDEGYSLLEDVKTEALETGKEEIFTDAYIKQISYLIFKEEYLTAINQCENFAEISDSDELKAEIFFELGKLYLILDDMENAARVFRLVNDYSPTFDIEFGSMFEYAKIKKNEGKIEESLELFNDIRNENKFADSLGIVELEIADIYYKNGEVKRALDHLTFIDTTYQRDKSGGIAKFRRAQIYETDYVDYDTAMIFYSSVLNSLAPKQLKDIAQNKYRVLDKYAIYHQNIKDNLRLISYIDDPSLFVRDSIAYEVWLERRTRRADSLANLQQTDRQRLTTPGSERSGSTNTIDNTSRTNQRPNYSATQRSSSDDNIDDLDVIIYPPPKPTVSADSLYKMIAKEQYDLGNLFFTDLNVLDSAYFYYERVLTDYPTNHYYARALYAMGTYYLTLDNKVKADSIFQIIYNEYPNESVFEAAARQLGKIQSDDEEDPAYALYIVAEEKYYNAEIDSAIQAYMNIYYEHSESLLAPKALFAVGYILENDLQDYDSAAVIYKLLASDYADSHYTLLTEKKLNNYIMVNEPPEPPAISDEAENVDILDTPQPNIIERDSVLPVMEKTDTLQDSLKQGGKIKSKSSIQNNPKLRRKTGIGLKEEEQTTKQDSTKIEE